MKFHKMLKKLRAEYEITQIEFAKKFEVARSTISKLENGQIEPSVDLLNKMSDYFNVSVDYLLGKESNFEYKFDKTNTNNIEEFIKSEVKKHLKTTGETEDLGEYITVVGNAKAKDISPERLQGFIDFLFNEDKKKDK